MTKRIIAVLMLTAFANVGAQPVRTPETDRIVHLLNRARKDALKPANIIAFKLSKPTKNHAEAIVTLNGDALFDRKHPQTDYKRADSGRSV